MSGGGSPDGDPRPLESWLGGRMDRVPAEFRPWLDVDEDDDGPADEGGGEWGNAERSRGASDGTGEEDRTVGRALEHRGLRALRRASSAPGRNRDSAFHLLAADAHLTWSTEALAESSDPESELRALVRRIVAEGP